MKDLKPGTRIHILETSELRDSRGRRIARYLPDFKYRITPVNVEHLRAEIAAGRARVDGENGAAKPSAAEGKVRGGVTVAPKASE